VIDAYCQDIFLDAEKIIGQKTLNSIPNHQKIFIVNSNMKIRSLKEQMPEQGRRQQLHRLLLIMSFPR
jgi:hypothetical protein